MTLTELKAWHLERKASETNLAEFYAGMATAVPGLTAYRQRAIEFARAALFHHNAAECVQQASDNLLDLCIEVGSGINLDDAAAKLVTCRYLDESDDALRTRLHWLLKNATLPVTSTTKEKQK